MGYVSHLLIKIKLRNNMGDSAASKTKAHDKTKIHNLIAQATESNNSQAIAAVMSDARYLRQSSSLINDALQRGFDVMQLADGSVVISGVKTVSYQYEWDEASGKLVRNKSTAQKHNTPLSKARVNMSELDAEDEMEEI